MGLLRRSIISALSVGIIGICGVLLLSVWSITGWKTLAIPTGSMQPAIPPGSLAFVHRVPISSLKRGDVITYINPLHPKTTLSHRIVRIYKLDQRVTTFVTKGDANSQTDIPVTSGSVIGRMTHHIPYLGYPLIWLKSPLGVIILVDIPALIIMAGETKRLRDYYKLCKPYRAVGYEGHAPFVVQRFHKAKQVTALFAISLAISALAGPSALALLQSNTVMLTVNHLQIEVPKKTPQCSGSTTNETTITVEDTTSQNASTGNVHSTDGTAASGNASNNSKSNININVTNC